MFDLTKTILRFHEWTIVFLKQILFENEVLQRCFCTKRVYKMYSKTVVGS